MPGVDPERAAHLPMDRRLALALGRELPGRTSGAALFADLGGFTRLSLALTGAYGRSRGVDELSKVLDAVYGAVVSEIHGHGGSVIGFSGDAVTCWFDDLPVGLVGGAPAPGPVRALAAATRIVAAVASLPSVQWPEPSGTGRHHLAVKVAVASGPVSRALAGDPEQQVVEVVGGTTIARLADLESVAEDGEVLVDETTASVAVGHGAMDLAAVIARRPTPGGPGLAVSGAMAPPCPWDRAAATDLAPEVVDRWIGRARRGLVGLAPTELRPVVALFLQFAPLPFDDDPAAPSRLDHFVRWVQHAVEPHDGNLLQLTVGDKASYLYVCFGAPRSHEDLADRAAAAALALAEPPQDLVAVRPVRIGVAHGTARVGAYGAVDARTYGALGDGTNLAARLMTAAEPGTILLSRRVADACGPSFRTAEHDPVVAKGFLDPVPVVRLVGRTAYLAPDAAHRRALVGREGAVADVVRRLAQVAEGAGGTTVLRGEAGIGKSHLVAEAKRRVLAAADLTWLEVRATERGEALQPFLTLLRDLTFQGLAATTADGRALFDATLDALVDELRARVPVGHPAELADRLDGDRSYLAGLLDLATEGSPYDQHEPGGRFERCQDALALLLEAEAARRPLVVHVADAHWLDDASRRLLGLLRRTSNARSLAVLVDERSVGVEAPVGSAGVGPVDESLDELLVELGPLDRAGVRELVAAVLGGEADEALVAAVHERSGGGPLFVEQLVAELADRGGIRLDVLGRWTATAGGVDELPVALSTLLVSRLDALPPEVGAVVQQAAVLGAEVGRDELVEVVRDTQLVSRAERFAAAAGIWEPVPEDAGRLRFRHVLVRDAAYEMQPADRLRETHRRAAAAIAALHADDRDPDAVAPALAHHLEAAGQPAAALTLRRRAARAAQRVPAPAEARRHLQGALSAAVACEAPARIRVELLRDLAGNAMAAGDYAAAVDELTEALGLLGPDDDPTLLHHRLGGALARWGRLDEAEAAYEAGVASIQDHPDTALAGHLYAGLAMVSCERGELDAAADLAELALALAQAAGDPYEQAWAHHRSGVVALRRGDHGVARDHACEALVAFRGLGRPAGQAGARNTLGLVALAEGAGDEAIEELEAAVALFERSGNEHGLACGLDNLADALRRRGRTDEAFACLERAVEILARIGLGHQVVFGSMWRAGAW